MFSRSRLLRLCTGFAFAFVMLTAAVAATKVDTSHKPSGDKGSKPSGRHPEPYAAGAGHATAATAPPKAPQIILYDQTDNQGLDAFNSQDFESFYDQYDDQAADDFVVSGAGWSVTTVTTPGVYFNGPGPASSLHITFYDDDGTGLPGGAVCDYPIVTTFTGAASGSFTATLSPACNLTPGTKWVSVVANMDFDPGGQWGWSMRTVMSGNPAAWQNPGGGFGSCPSWGARAFLCAPTTSAEPDQVFRLDGTFSSCASDADCQDGDLCDGVETCVANACQPGTPVNCDDGLFCTIDACAPATGTCSHAPNPCADGNGCTVDACNEATDTCSHFSPPTLRLCNAGSIAIPDSGTSTPYPSTITVAGLGSSGGLCSVELNGITHTFPSDIDMLLVGPGTPQNAIIMSDAGGSSPAAGVNLVLNDSAALPIPTPLVSGTFQPTNVGAGDLFAGAPTPTGGSALGVFDGTDPNGDWKLFVVDDAGGDQGSVDGGWCINIVVAGCTSNAQCDDSNACNGVETCVAGNCTAGTPVNCDDGLFCTDDSCAPATGACSHTPKTCSDGNSCTLDACDEAADACVSTNVSIHLCNTGSITIPAIGAASPYPSPINVSGQPTAGSVCSVELNGITHTFPDDIDILLARTSGPNAMIMSDVGGGGDVVNLNLTLNDGAASSLPDAGPLVSGTFKPTDIGTPDAAFPAPAPAISGGTALSTFDGQDPNGVWNLWVRDEFAGDSGSISNGWCLNLIVSSCTTNAECQDGNVCNGFETCVAGSCTPGTPVDCNDGLFCTVDTCDPATGTCGHAPNTCADADGCTTDSCDEGADACVHTYACTQVCNTASIAINDSTVPPTVATPYPSVINIAGGSGLFTLVSVELRGITHTFPDDIDILLAAPNVANGAIIMSDVGGSAVANGVNLTLTDGAPPIPDAGPLVNGIFSPTNVNPGTGTESWPAPAPVPSGSSALSQFNGSNPNGDWMLFVVDDQAADLGSLAGGWCLNYKTTCSTPADCNDGNACTTDTCDATGSCSHTAIACNDGNACNGVETCDPASGCVAGTPLVCDDGNACNGIETCDPALGCVAGTPINCGDGNVCNGAESCNPTTGCIAGTPLNCNDGNACNGVETCNPASGCVAGTPPVCNDGNACNGVETCNPASGCVPGTPPSCDDGNACTVDSCNPASGCAHTPLSCNDGNACNGVETCNPASGCVAGTPPVCNDGNACNGVETCNPASGCVAGTPLSCNDGNACNGVETCNPASGCVAGTPPVCNDGNACNGVETCNPASGCVAGTPLNCDDGSACTVDFCTAASGCVHTPVSCNDGNACNGVETCNPASGCVAGTPLVCNDGNACNGVETCNPASGCVAGTPLVCNDGNACNGVETCNPASGCHAGTPVVCAAPDQCHVAGVCAPATGVCAYANKPNGTTCDDGNSSTSGDTCQNGVCTGSSCASSNNPRTKGWYKQLCKHPHGGDAITNADAACVGNLTASFAGFTTAAQVCNVLDGDGHHDDWSSSSCAKAEDQLMALALNICKHRVCPDDGIDSHCDSNGHEDDLVFDWNHHDDHHSGDHSTVGASLATADAIVNSPSHSSGQCDQAECLAKEINNGHALEFATLLATREGANVRLQWVAPLLDDGTGTPSSYKIWRRPSGSDAPFVQVGSTLGLTYLDVTAGTSGWQYDITGVFPNDPSDF